jgi:virulence factor Mce-like protein
MRRVLALIIAALVAVLAIIAFGARAESAGTYRVDAIFDTAKGIIPGQVVKVAGARVGSIDDVRLTHDYKARIVMSVPRRFEFRQDASCNIQPEGLISENFVQCDPGSPGREPLGGEPVPTVPVDHTAVPVSITDLFRIFQADVRQRFTVAMMALGGGLAARGEDLNEIIRRSNPTLGAVRRLTRDLAAQKDSLDAAVRDTDRVIAALAQRKDKVTDFIEQAARVTRQTADHRSELADSIRRLPPLLDATDTALGELDRLITNGRPLLGELRAAAPGLEQAIDRIGPFARAGRPALVQLGQVAEIAKPTITAATPLVALLRRFTLEAGPAGRTLADLLVNLRDSGSTEYLGRFVYFSAAATSRFDSTSHVLPAHAVDSLQCATYAKQPVEGCNAFFRGMEAPAGEERRRRAGSERERGDQPAQRAPEAPATASPAPTTAPTTTPTPAVALPPILKPLEDLTKKLPPIDRTAANDLADFLLGP